MHDCWLSPYGEVIWCSGAWNHNQDAINLLIERYGYKDIIDIDDTFPFKLATDILTEVYGWCRYSTCANRGWLWIKPLTTEQKNKIFDLTGELFD